jgi:acetylornithine deacetylase/succinyl-diaminopimelate desuccinylase-like protein
MSDNKLRDYFNHEKERFIGEWKKFLSFPSISTDSSYAEACGECANWLADHLLKLGFQCEVLQTKGYPVVFAERKGVVERPSVLFYGHYDVQPPDPLELWRSAPFEPEIRNGRMYARGAQDNKGQVFYFIKAVEALLAHNIELPTIKMLIEGEEESGSEGITAELPGWSERVTADILMVCDTGMIDASVPTITMGLRGMAGCEVRVHGPSYDLHSGVFGGIVANPLHEVARIAASLHDESGKVAVPGFYDGVEVPSMDLSKRVSEAPIDIERLQETVGVPFVGGEKGFGVLERRGLRPTLEINGIGGGYQGAGGKTVIPSSGFMKISMRLVKGQDPQRVLSLLESFIVGSVSEGCRVEVIEKNAGGEALLLSVDSDILKTASRVILDEFNVEPALLWEGASIPIIPLLEQVSGAAPLLIGFGLEEDAIHAPNESFSIKQFEDGFRYVTALLQRL